MLRACRALVPQRRVSGNIAMWRRNNASSNEDNGGRSSSPRHTLPTRPTMPDEREVTPSEPFQRLQVHDHWRPEPHSRQPIPHALNDSGSYSNYNGGYPQREESSYQPTPGGYGYAQHGSGSSGYGSPRGLHNSYSERVGDSNHPRHTHFGDLPTYDYHQRDDLVQAGPRRTAPPPGMRELPLPPFPPPSLPIPRGLHTSSASGSSPISTGRRSPLILRSQSPRVASSTPAPETFIPPTEHIDISKEPLTTSDEITPKLLVLDLNGALVYRPSRSGTDRRKAFPRPFLNCFLQYLFEPEPEGTRPWEVFVWSSAQPHNVRHMVETCFGLHYTSGVYEEEPADVTAKREERGEGRLLGVWARDTLGLATADYGKKVQTRKDLRKVIANFPKYDERTTVLLDDSPHKAAFQPWSQIVIPEFDKTEHNASRRAAERLASFAEPVDAEGYRLRAYSPSRAAEEDISELAVKPKIDVASEPGMDNILLAVIGILEDMRTVSNVPAWMRAGGVQKPTGERIDITGEVTLDGLPSHAGFVHWYAQPETHAYWVERGKAGLERKGIELGHGLREGEEGLDSMSNSAVEERSRRLHIPTHAPQAKKIKIQPMPTPEIDLTGITIPPDVDEVAVRKRAIKLLAAGNKPVQDGPVGNIDISNITLPSPEDPLVPLTMADVEWFKTLSEYTLHTTRVTYAARQAAIKKLLEEGKGRELSIKERQMMVAWEKSMRIDGSRLARVTVSPGPELVRLAEEVYAPDVVQEETEIVPKKILRSRKRRLLQKARRTNNPSLLDQAL